MATEAQVVESIRKYRGVTEHPRGSNCNQFSKRLGRKCERWCGDCAACAYLDVGIDTAHAITPNTASCLALYTGAKAKGLLVPRSQILPGDQILYQFDHDAAPDHTEIATSAVKNNVFTACGGNTGHGYQANGGEVYEQERNIAVVMGVIRVPGVDHGVVHTPQPTQSLAVLRRAFASTYQPRCLALPVPLDKNTPNQPTEDIKTLQWCINIVETQANIVIDGVYGDKTVFCVLAFQEIMKSLNGGASATPHDFPGQFGVDTRWLMAASLTKVAQGLA